MDAYTKLYIEHLLGDLMRGLGAEFGRSERQTHDFVLQVVENLTKTIEAQGKNIELLRRELKGIKAQISKAKKEEAEPTNGQSLTVIGGGRAS
jgi:hypothetical protein